MSEIIQTARLALRPLAPEDAAPLSALMTPAIARWTGSWRGDETPDDVTRRIDAYIAADARGFALPRAITIKGAGGAIGVIAVSRLGDRSGLGAIGYWIGEPYFGQGFTREAARAILDAAWAIPELRIIEGVAQLSNIASHRVLLGLGMTKTGERMEFASARGAADLCAVYEIEKP